MKKARTIIVFCILVGLTLSACGPSPEAVATMTASAWTPTPEPTLTPTPLPFDLTVSLLGEDGEMVYYNAAINATEHEEVLADASGEVTLINLPGPEGEVSAAAQGFEPLTENLTLERGMNEMTFTLTVDPLQVNPTTACSDGQTLLYIEDFEDGFAQGWDGISRPRYAFEEIEGRGTVLTFSEENTEGAGTPIEEGKEFGNFVWKWDTFNDNDLFLHIHETGDRKYLIRFQPGGEGIQIIHQEGPEHKTSAYRGFNNFEWISVAIAFFENALEFYINDELYVALDDPDPIPSGGFMMHFTEPGAKASIDNMVICELTEPYVPVIAEESSE